MRRCGRPQGEPKLIDTPVGTPSLAGIPAIVFATDDIHTEFARLSGHGVAFTMEPTSMGPVTQTVFDDTCGNLIALTQAD